MPLLRMAWGSEKDLTAGRRRSPRCHRVQRGQTEALQTDSLAAAAAAAPHADCTCRRQHSAVG